MEPVTARAWPIVVVGVLASCAGPQAARSPDVRLFQPKARVYFDKGTDDPMEVDIFDDGSFVPALDAVQLYWPHEFLTCSRSLDDADNRWGFNLGIGLNPPADDSEDPTGDSASGAPVVLVSAGALLEFPVGGNGSSVGLEFGYAQGWSADENLLDIDDSAYYVGLNFNLMPSSGGASLEKSLESIVEKELREAYASGLTRLRALSRDPAQEVVITDSSISTASAEIRMEHGLRPMIIEFRRESKGATKVRVVYVSRNDRDLAHQLLEELASKSSAPPPE